MESPEREAFYVGYLPRCPAPLAGWLGPRLGMLLVLVAGLAGLLATAYEAPDPGCFEYGVRRSFEGRVALRPEPRLLVEAPGGAGESSYLLVEAGKRGAEARMARFEGQRVRLEGSLVHRDQHTMIELSQAPILEVPSPAGASLPGSELPLDLGLACLRGEIVDSKCFLGVMKPGRGKVHKACATRCIAGGVPPVLWVNAPEGSDFLLLVAPDGGDLREAVLEHVAEPVEITGQVLRYGDVRVLRAEPQNIRPLP